MDVIGDNLAVVRYIAHSGRLRNPVHDALLSVTLGRVLTKDILLHPYAVRRRFNKEADAIATEAVRHAASLRGAEQYHPVLSFSA